MTQNGEMNGTSIKTSSSSRSLNGSDTWLSQLVTDIPIPDPDDPDLTDPHCDPDHPVKVTHRDVSAAHYRIRDGILRTACKKSPLSKVLNMNLYLKMELHQVTGSFKERGARNFLLHLTKEQRENGVIASSAGNHAQALAYHGKDLGIPVTVVMPTNAPIVKVENCINYGANVLLKGKSMTEAKPYAMKVGKLNNIPYVNGYDHPYILAGQGTIGLEILEQVPNVDAIIIPVGGGGLIAGIAAAVKEINRNVQIIGAESDRCPSFTNSLKDGKMVVTPINPTVADGLAVSHVGVNALHTSIGLVDKMVCVDEAHIHRAILRLLEAEKCVVEGAGATALAALMAGLLPELVGKTVVPILSGGNIDSTVLGRVIERGLAFEGRLCRFVVVVKDRPGGIAEMCTLLADHGASIKDIFHERAWMCSSIYSVQVKCVCETRDGEHAAEIERALRQKYDKVVWGPWAT